MTAPHRRPAIVRPAPRRLRLTSFAGGLSLSLALLAGCADTPTPPSPGAEDVPSTLPAKPKLKKQPKARIVADAPQTYLTGMSQASADQVWQQSLDLVSEWLLNPAYMQRHQVRSVRELDGLTKLMTPEAAALWRKQAHTALRCYARPYTDCWRDQPKRQLPIEQLVTFMVPLRADRGWDNPMMTPVRIKDALMLSANGQFGVIMPISTKYRLIGQGREYRVASTSVLGLAWTQQDGEWKISQWWRVYRFDREKIKGWRPGEAPPTEAGTPDTAPLPSADATLYPE